MREFVMGARMVLNDVFSHPIRGITDATKMFTGSVQRADDETGHWRDSMGRLRDAMGRYVTEARRADDATHQMSASASHAASSLHLVRNALLGIATFQTLRGANNWLITGNAEMETYLNTLTVVMHSQQKAAEQLGWAEDFAAKTPFEIPQVVEATVKLEAYGMSARKVLGVTGDMASVMGKPLMQAVEAVADAQTGELERLKEFGITKKMLIDQANKLGLQPVVNKQGSVTDQAGLNAALFSLMAERFKGGMDLQSKTFNGMLSNVSDFVGTAGRTLGKPIFDRFKVGLSGVLVDLTELKDSGAFTSFADKVDRGLTRVGTVFREAREWAGSFYEFVRLRVQIFQRDNAEALTKFSDDFAKGRNAVDDLMIKAQPVFDWLTHEALPLTVELVADVAEGFVSTAEFFHDNWDDIKPFVEGLTIAFTAYGGYLITLTGITKIVTAAQWAWNIAMNANPIGLVITGIGLLIGAGIWLYQNWDVAKEKAWGLWETLRNNPILAIVGGPFAQMVLAGGYLIKNWDSIKTAAVSTWVDIQNAFISGANTAVSQWNRLMDLAGADSYKVGYVEYVSKPGAPAPLANKPVTNPTNPMGGYRGSGSATPPANPFVHGSHANGLPFVPFDDYIARLHKGEEVVPANVAQARRQQAKTGINPAGSVPSMRTGSVSKSVTLKVEQGAFVIQGADKDSRQLAVEIMGHMYDMMQTADDTLSTASRGDIL